MCWGRLSRTGMLDEARHPAMMATDLHISDFLIHHIHLKMGHSGCNHVLSELHLGYWIPGLSVDKKKTLSKFVGHRLHAGPGGQHSVGIMAIDKGLSKEGAKQRSMGYFCMSGY